MAPSAQLGYDVLIAAFAEDNLLDNSTEDSDSHAYDNAVFNSTTRFKYLADYCAATRPNQHWGKAEPRQRIEGGAGADAALLYA